MFYYLSKIFWLFAQPSSLAAIALTIGLATLAVSRFRRAGLALAFSGLALFVGGGFLPVSNYLVYPLEERFAKIPLPAAGEPVAGIIILGGFEEAWVSGGRPGLAVNEAAERLTEGVRLARRWPGAKVVFTGGVGGLFDLGDGAAGPVGEYLAAVGIARDRIVLEGKSRNTWENATLTLDLIKPQAGDRWVLVTSAYHMPRSMGVFRTAGFEVIPAPVDFRTRDSRDLFDMFSSPSDGLKRFDMGVREWIGLVGYWLFGRTDALFPRPA